MEPCLPDRMVHFLGPTGPVASIFVRVTQRYNLARLGEQAFELKGDYPSLLYEGRWYRSGELFECAQRIGGGLAEMGVSPGERVVVTMANCPEVGVVYQALWRAGAVITPATFLRAADDDREPACARARRGRAAALVRSTGVSGADRGAPPAPERGRPHHASATPLATAREIRPLVPSVRDLGRRPAGARGRRG